MNKKKLFGRRGLRGKLIKKADRLQNDAIKKQSQDALTDLTNEAMLDTIDLTAKNADGEFWTLRHDFAIFASMKPAREVGGDFYDYFLVDDDHLAMVMADVAGKGIPAAMFMMMTRSMIQTQASAGCGPKEILETVNQLLYENNKARMFVTVWVGILNLKTGTLTSANAGHATKGTVLM